MVRAVYLIRLLSPVLVRSRRHRVGFEPLRERIPASSVAGALVAAGLLEASSVENGRVVLSDAYPVVLGGNDGTPRPAMPSYAACFRIKEGAGTELDGMVVCVPRACDEDEPAETVLDELERLSSETGAPLAVLSKPSIGEPIVYEREYKGLMVASRFSPRGFWRDSVAMSLAYRRGEEGLLYSYEAVWHPLWWGTATLPDEVLEKLRDGVEVFVGGGRGRGFGHAIIAAEPVEYPSVEPTRWFMLWSPLPLPLAAKTSRRVSRLARGLAASWGQEGPRPAIPSLMPGSLVEPVVSTSPAEARFSGLAAPWGVAEPCYAKGRSVYPPSVGVASEAIRRLVRRVVEKREAR